MGCHFEVPASDLRDSLVVPVYRARGVLKSLRETCETRRLGEIAELSSGTYVKRYSGTHQGLPYLRVDNVRELACNLTTQDLKYVSRRDPSINRRVSVVAGDVLLSRTGTIGKVALACGPILGSILSQHVTRVSSLDSDFDAAYLATFLCSSLGKSQLLAGAYGSTRPELTHQSLSRIEIPLLDSGVQKTIRGLLVAPLEEYYEAASRIQEAICAYEALFRKHPIANERAAFETEGIEDLWTPRANRPEFLSEIRRLKDSFSCGKLGTLASVERGRGTRVSEYASEGVPFVRTTDIINFGIDPFPDHYANESIYGELSQHVQQRDILCSIEGKIGCVALLSNEDDCVFKNHIERIRSFGDVPSEQIFLHLASVSGQTQIEALTVVQSTLPGLANRMRQILIPMRPIGRDGHFEETIENAIGLISGALPLRDRAIRKLREARRTLSHALAELAA